MTKNLLVLICCVLGTYMALGQTQNTPKQAQNPSKKDTAISVNPIPEEGDQPAEARYIVGEKASPFRSFEFMLSIVIVIFGVLIIGAEVYLARLKVIESDQIFKVIIVTLIIIAGLILITA